MAASSYQGYILPCSFLQQQRESLCPNKTSKITYLWLLRLPFHHWPILSLGLMEAQFNELNLWSRRWSQSRLISVISYVPEEGMWGMYEDDYLGKWQVLLSGQRKNAALASVAQLIGRHLANWKITGLVKAHV